MTELFDELTKLPRLPPHSLDAEEAVLGSILIDPVAITKVDLITPDDFYREKNRWTFEACQSLYKRHEPTDQITVATELARDGKLEAAGGAAYLSHLISQIPTSVHAEYYAKIVAKCSVMRRLITTADQIAGLAYNSKDVDEALTKSRQALDRIQPRTTNVMTSRQYADRAFSYVEKAQKKQQSPAYFGMPKLDRETGGLYPGEYTILGARPGMGKSTLQRQWLHHMAKKHESLYVQVEMSESQNIERDLASAVRRPVVEIRQGGYKSDVVQAMYAGLAEHSDLKVHYMIDGSATTAKIRNAALRLKEQCDLKVIFVDYLQILKDKPSVTESYERTSYISSELLAICNDLDVAMVCACQLSRKLEERVDKRPGLADLRDSGKLEENADNVFFLYRQDAYRKHNEEPDHKAELIIAKHRQGARTGSIDMLWLPERQEYGEIEGRVGMEVGR